MGNKNRNFGENPGSVVDQPVGETAAGPNMVLTYRREHPGARCSYGIAGNPGIVVFDKGLFAGGAEPGFVAPATITLDCVLVPVKADNKTAKAEAAAAKLAEKSWKAQAKVEATAAKVAAKAAKAAEALEKANAKIKAAADKAAAAVAAATTGGDQPTE